MAPATRHGGLGWLPDLPDHRDYRYEPPRAAIAKLPSSFSLRDKVPFVRDQGSLGSCTANAIAAALDVTLATQGKPPLDASRLFIYWNERSLEGTVESDAGAFIRDGIKSVHRLGAPPESLWQYDVARFADRPHQPAYDEALAHQVERYERVQRRARALKAAIFTGHPVVIGFTVYASFESDAVARSGAMPMPQPGEEAIGGHAVAVVGWDDTGMDVPRWHVLNSWGSGWGAGGFFWMPQGYLLDPNLSDDFWCITLVEAA